MGKPLPADLGTAEELKRITDNLYVDGLEAHLPFNKRRHLGGIADPIGHAQERLVNLLALERLKAALSELYSLDTRRHYCKDYQESLDELDVYKYERIAELDKQIKELKRG